MPRKKRDESGKWKKGYSGNPNGRPTTDLLTDLQDAIKVQGRKKGKTLVQHFVQRAYEEDKVLISIFKKLLPDLKSVDARLLLQGGLDLSHYTDRELDKEINKLEGILNSDGNDSGHSKVPGKKTVAIKRKKH